MSKVIIINRKNIMDYITVAEAANFLGVSPSTVQGRIESGQLPCVWVGMEPMIHPEKLTPLRSVLDRRTLRRKYESASERAASWKKRTGYTKTQEYKDRLKGKRKSKKPQLPEGWVTVAQYAKEKGVSRAAVYVWINSGKVGFVNFNGKIIIEL